MPDALQLLREDHSKVKQLFKQFEQADETSEKQRIANEALMELEVHAEIEEEIFYPRMMKQPGATDMLLEAEEEHAVAKNLIAELRAMRSVNDRYEAKFKVLSEYVLHHVQEEEEQMFPKAAELGREFLDDAGSEMSARKMELMQNGGVKKGRRSSGAGSRRTSTARSRSGASTAGGRTAGGRTARPAAGSRRTSRSTTAGARATGTRSAKRGTAKPETATRGTAKRATTAARATAKRATTATRGTAKRATAKSASTPRATAGARSRAAGTRTTSARKSAATRSRANGTSRSKAGTTRKATSTRGR